MGDELWTVARVRTATLGVLITAFLVLASGASAQTLGTTTKPSASTPTTCTSGAAFYTETATDTSYDYVVPSAGEIDSWSTNTTGDTASAPMTLVVLHPSTASSYKIIGFDNETLPSPLPANNVATFSLAQPIAVSPGDTIGLYWGGGTFTCAFSGGSIPAADVDGFGTAGAPVDGKMYSVALTQASFLINVSANFVQSQDVSITGSASPSPITTGGVSEYAFTVTNSGPGTAPIAFTDTVPAGLTILSAVAGSGTCSTTGQLVTCSITGLPAGSTAEVLVIVSAASAGSYQDTGAVSIEFADPTPADNSASATLDVADPGAPSPGPAPGPSPGPTPGPTPPASPLTVPATPSCHTVSLAGIPLSVAKTVLPTVDCAVGKVTKRASKKVRKGYVISTSPGPGKTLAAGSAISFVVSSGPPKTKKRTAKKSTKTRPAKKK